MAEVSSDLMRLPRHLLEQVLKELDFRSLTVIQRCSSELKFISERLLQSFEHLRHFSVEEVVRYDLFDWDEGEEYKVKTETECHYSCGDRYYTRKLESIPLNCKLTVDKLSFKNFTPSYEFKPEDCDIFMGRSVKVRVLVIEGTFSCDHDSFNDFVQKYAIEELCGDRCFTFPPINNRWIDKSILEAPACEKLSSIVMFNVCSRVIPDNLMILSATTLVLPTIDSASIHTMLKEWRAGSRNIVRLQTVVELFFNYTDSEVIAVFDSEVRNQLFADMEMVEKKCYENDGEFEAAIARRDSSEILTVKCWLVPRFPDVMFHAFIDT